MKKLIEWLEVNNTRTRKVIAIFTTFIWAFATIAAYVFNYKNIDIMGIYSIVTAQFTAVIAFYMTTKPGATP